MTGKIGPHNDRELELLLAGTKPAAWLGSSEVSPEQLDDLRERGFLIEEREVIPACPTPTGQLQLDVGEAALKTWPRRYLIAPTPEGLLRLRHALAGRSCAEIGRALGYTDDDIAACYEQHRTR